MADTWLIKPSGPLNGDVVVAGAKNAVNKHMVAALLASTPSVITNAPKIAEVDITANILEALGAGVTITDDRIDIDPGDRLQSRIPRMFWGVNRVPILLLAPLLHREGEAFISPAGGDQIGARRIDIHLDALRTMGAEITETAEGVHARTTGLHGGRVCLRYPSVMATETALLAAAKADGRTVIENAAIEPEVVELALFLQRMGARIEMRPERRFVIEGVEELAGSSHRLGGDRIEAFSYLVAGLVTGGRVRVYGCPQDRLVTGISTLMRMGVRFEIADEWISAEADGLLPAAVATDVHPGFMTDWHQPLLVLFTQASGMSVLHETVFEDRLGYVDGLRQMGAEIEVFEQCLVGSSCQFHERNDRHSAVVRGISRLEGASVEIPDVRAGFSYLIAAAAAKGESKLGGVRHIERAYDRPLEKFSSLGLDITVL